MGRMESRLDFQKSVLHNLAAVLFVRHLKAPFRIAFTNHFCKALISHFSFFFITHFRIVFTIDFSYSFHRSLLEKLI